MHNKYCRYLSRRSPQYKTNYCLYVNTLISFMDKNNIKVDLMEHLEKKKNLIDIIGGKN